MRAFFAIFLVLIFLSGQVFAGLCLGDCAHDNGSHQEQSKEMESDHDCCQGISEKSEDSSHHECSINNCVAFYPAQSKEIVLASEVTQKIAAPDLATEPIIQFRLANLSSKVLALDRSNLGPPLSSVPLYIYYQKLLLPHCS